MLSSLWLYVAVHLLLPRWAAAGFSELLEDDFAFDKGNQNEITQQSETSRTVEPTTASTILNQTEMTKPTSATISSCPWRCDNNKCGRPWVPVKKIAGGTTVKRFSWPWMGDIWSNDTLVCGATLICQSWVITAAHCFLDTRGRQIDLITPRNLYLGRYLKRGSYKAVKEIKLLPHMITVHNEYNIKRSYNDIALIRLPKPIKFSRRFRPVCLPNTGSKPPSLGVKCRVAGWGKTMGLGPTNKRLKEASLPLVSTDICKNTYYFSKTQQILCAGGKEDDACSGDSGGALICESVSSPGKWEVQGIISFGATKCGTAKLPGIYTKVVHYLEWIQRIIADECLMWSFLYR